MQVMRKKNITKLTYGIRGSVCPTMEKRALQFFEGTVPV